MVPALCSFAWQANSLNCSSTPFQITILVLFPKFSSSFLKYSLMGRKRRQYSRQSALNREVFQSHRYRQTCLHSCVSVGPVTFNPFMWFFAHMHMLVVTQINIQGDPLQIFGVVYLHHSFRYSLLLTLAVLSPWTFSSISSNQAACKAPPWFHLHTPWPGNSPKVIN